MLLGFTLAQRAIFCPENENNFQRSRPRILSEVRTPTTYHKLIWLVVSTPLKNISQLGWLFPICINLSTCSKCHLGHWVQVEMIQTYAGFTWGIYFIFTQSCGTRSPGIFLFLILLAEGRTEGELRWTECVFFSNGHVILVGGWATPLKNMSSSVGIIIPFIPNIWEILKHVPVIQSPPTRSIFYQWRSQSGNQLHGCKTTRFEHVRWMKQKKTSSFFW